MSGLEDTFSYYMRFLAPDLAARMVEQHPVGAGRRYRFDFAWPADLVAVELHGGLWSRGAHSRPQGIQRDLNKQNFAVLNGWRVLYFSTDDVEDDPEDVINTIRTVLERKTA